MLSSLPLHRPTANLSSSNNTTSPYPSVFTHLYHPSPSQPLPSSKRQKTEHDFTFSDTQTGFDDCPPLIHSSSTSMPQAVPRARLLPPHINVQRASEPSSPVTIASTISNYSTPSPSPSGVTIVSADGAPHDFALYEEGFSAQETQPKSQLSRRIMPSLYPPNTSSPAVAGSRFNGNYDGNSAWHSSADGFGKLPSQQHYYNNGVPGYSPDTLALARSQAMLHHNSQPHPDDDEVPALSPSHATHMTASSRPSISESDMPATPIQSPSHANGHVGGPAHRKNTLPKLSRTISDAVQDELFNPGIAPGTARVHNEQGDTSQSSQFSTIFQQAQSQHAMARSTPTKPTVRGDSPFRADSPYHPGRTSQEVAPSPTRQSSFLPVGGYPTARAQRERDMEHEAQALREKMQREYEDMQKDPKTISPKDAYIEYHEPEGDGVHGSLFDSQHEDAYSQGTNSDALSSNGSYHSSLDDEEHDVKQESSQMNYNLPIFSNLSPQYQHQFLEANYGWPAQRASHNTHDLMARSPLDDDYDSTMSGTLQRPDDMSANSGTYSCTVHGCTQRFPTASKMSKHRREAHRHGTPMNRDTSVRAQHQGPHRCTRINPTTGKPCNTIFSRPYDLTRHEDTIHNTAREKVRCEICKDEKTFSRHDALTRHKKVKHGIDK